MIFLIPEFVKEMIVLDELRIFLSFWALFYLERYLDVELELDLNFCLSLWF
jgi:hypothetical protein